MKPLLFITAIMFVVSPLLSCKKEVSINHLKDDDALDPAKRYVSNRLKNDLMKFADDLKRIENQNGELIDQMKRDATHYHAILLAVVEQSYGHPDQVCIKTDSLRQTKELLEVITINLQPETITRTAIITLQTLGSSLHRIVTDWQPCEGSRPRPDCILQPPFNLLSEEQLDFEALADQPEEIKSNMICSSVNKLKTLFAGRLEDLQGFLTREVTENFRTKKVTIKFVKQNIPMSWHQDTRLWIMPENLEITNLASLLTAMFETIFEVKKSGPGFPNRIARWVELNSLNNFEKVKLEFPNLPYKAKFDVFYKGKPDTYYGGFWSEPGRIHHLNSSTIVVSGSERVWAQAQYACREGDARYFTCKASLTGNLIIQEQNAPD